MTNTFIIASKFLPILVVILTYRTVPKNKTMTAMFLGSISALALSHFLNGFSISDLVNGAAGIAQSKVMNNIPLLVATVLLGILNEVIKNSSVKGVMTEKICNYIPNRSYFILVILGFTLLFSCHDYVCTLLTIGILANSAEYFGVSKEKLSVCTNLLVSSTVTLAPYSTWAPVIGAPLTESGISRTNYLFHTFYIVIAFGFILGYAFFEKEKRVSVPSQKKTIDKTSKVSSPSAVWAIILTSVSLIASSAVLYFLGVSDSVLYAAILTLLITVLFYRWKSLIEPDVLKKALQHGFHDMIITLFVLVEIWTFGSILTNFLKLDQTVTGIFDSLNLPIFLIPAVLFACGSVFSFSTCSTFSGFNVFLPIATSTAVLLEGRSELLAVIIGACLSGSLVGSLAATSDTFELAVKNSGADSNLAFSIQKNYLIAILITGILCYLACGTCTYFISDRVGILAAYLIVFLCVSLFSNFFYKKNEYDKSQI